MLTLFHNQEFNSKIDHLPIENANKQRMKDQATECMESLFKLAKFDPSD